MQKEIIEEFFTIVEATMPHKILLSNIPDIEQAKKALTQINKNNHDVVIRQERIWN